MKPAGILAAIACLVAIGATVRSQPDAPVARGFDHLVHEGKVAVAGRDAIACDTCHLVRGHVVPRPGHAACFGACHGDLPAALRARKPRPLDDERRRTCTVCHDAGAVGELEAGTARALPARPTIDADYGLIFSHQAHAGAACRDCHTDPDAPAPPARIHHRCAGCHDAEAAPAMTRCAGCHLAAYGPATAPHLADTPYPVEAAFSHGSHRDRPGGDDCRVCHGAVAGAADNALPPPTMAACASCHDGSTAFATTAATCTRCHAPPRVRLRRRDQPTSIARFSHAEHQRRGLDLACASCHALDEDGRPLPPAADHAPCSDAGCHADDFASLAPTICSGCHVGDEPWRPLHYDRPPADATELGARFSHQAHLSGEPARVSAACSDCHDAASASRDRRLGRDHGDCTGAGCHDAEAAPALTDCAGCHELGLVPQRARSRLAAPWSVRARFDHDRHRVDPRTDAPLPCIECHLGAADSARIESMPTPPKSTCAGCHDGETAFKVTGHGCARCHGP